MADSFVQVPPDASGKQIDSTQLSIPPNLVLRQRVVLADGADPDGVVNVTNGALNVNVESSGGVPFLQPIRTMTRSNGETLRPTPRMVDGYVQLPPDSTGKKLDTAQLNVGGNDVFRQRIVLADGDDPAGMVTVTNNALNVNIQGLGGTPLNIGTPVDGDVLTYEAVTGRWISKPPSAVAPPAFNFMDGEVVGGTGTSWVLLYKPDPVTSLQLFQNVPGVGNILLRLNIDYHITDWTITTTDSIAPGSLVAWYRYTDSTPGPAPPTAQPPTVTGITPSSGPQIGGTMVFITGTNFFAGATVTIGGVAATNVSLVSDSALSATTPPGTAGPANVAVTVSGQTGNLPGAFVYIGPPTVTGVSPSIGTTTGPTAVTITGTNFAGAASVTFGGTAATNVTVIDATTITATAPARAAGAVDVVVTISGQSGTLPNGFTYTAPPTVSSVTPRSGALAGGTPVTITGTNFAAGATVTFGGAAATNVVVVNSTTITATTSARSAALVAVVVTNSNGLSGNLGSAFNYAGPPTVTSLSPATGTADGGTAVTITGTNFYAGATVTFDGAAATNVVVVNATTITATTPAGAAGATTVTVTVSDQSGNLPNGFTYEAVAVQLGVYAGVGAAGATDSPITLSGTQVTLSNGIVLNQLKATAEEVNDVLGPVSPTAQCIYLLLHGGSRQFLDNATKFTFPFLAPITVSIEGTTMYLYRSMEDEMYSSWNIVISA